MTFTDPEARLLGAMLTGECDYNLLTEGGDYAAIWSKQVGLRDLDGFIRKLAKITLFRR